MQVDQNGVHVGKDGWLFLVAGSNEALRLLTDQKLFVSKDAENWALKLGERRTKLGALGSRYVHMWIPDKIKVYRDQLNFDTSVLSVDPPSMVYDAAMQTDVAGVLIDILPELLRRKTEHLLYWKTDTHWTYWGACIAYLALCEAVAAVPFEGLWDRPLHYTPLTLDLGSKLTPKIQEHWGGAQVLKDSKIIYKNELTQFLELLKPDLAAAMFRGVAVQFANSRPSCDKRRVLIFGDSFSEYRPHLLTGLLAETFRDVMFVWSAAIDYRLVAKFQADIVVTEMAERFIKTLPDDDFDNQVFVLDRITNFLNVRCGMGQEMFSWNRTAEARG
jgi:hypothetical protein